MTLAAELKRLDETANDCVWGSLVYQHCESQLMNLLPSLVALAEREAWQPIASAPRDGTLILLHGHDQINPGYYDATPRIGGYGPWHWGITFQPTHWMRLPEPPTPKE
jgi:hypothetical protein